MITCGDCTLALWENFAESGVPQKECRKCIFCCGSHPWIYKILVEKLLFEGDSGLEQVTYALNINGCNSRPQNVFAPWIYVGKFTYKLPNNSTQYCTRYHLLMMKMILKGGAKNQNINKVVLDHHFGHAPGLHICNVACKVSSEMVQN